MKTKKQRAGNEVDVFQADGMRPKKDWKRERRRFIAYDPAADGTGFTITWEDGERWLVQQSVEKKTEKPRRFSRRPPERLLVYPYDPAGSRNGIDVTAQYEKDKLGKMEGFTADIQSLDLLDPSAVPMESHSCVMDILPPAPAEANALHGARQRAGKENGKLGGRPANDRTPEACATVHGYIQNQKINRPGKRPNISKACKQVIKDMDLPYGVDNLRKQYRAWMRTRRRREKLK